MPSAAGHGSSRDPGAALHSSFLSGWIVVPFLYLTLIASRLAPMLLGSELNPDESQLMAQVMRLRLHPIPWRGMDGTTSGPLNTWALALAHAAGLPFDYHGVHALAAVVLATTCALTYVTLRVLAGRTIAQWGAAASVLPIVLVQGANYTHYSSELVPALLESVALCGFAVGLVRPRARILSAIVCGLAIGALPWAKLQATAGATALGAWVAWRMWSAHRRRDTALFIGALLLPSALLLAVVITGGAWNDFWSSYVLGNLGYVGRQGPGGVVRRALAMLSAPAGPSLVGVLCFAACWGWRKGPGWKTAAAPLREFSVAVALLAVATLLSVLTPRTFHAHYHLLLFQPLALASACLLAIWRSPDGRDADRRLALGVFAALVLGSSLLSIPAAAAGVRSTLALRQRIDATPEARIASAIRTVAPAGQRLVAWGWMPALYVRTGMAPGTRHAVCHFVIDPGPARERMRATFLDDVRTERPDIIVDAVAGGCFRWSWDRTDRLESFPELFEFVTAHYALVSEMTLDENEPQAPVRIYALRPADASAPPR